MSAKVNTCPFCDWKKRDDIIFVMPNFVFFESKYKIIKSHSLLITKSHVRNEKEITKDLWEEYMFVCRRAYSYIKKKYTPPMTFINAPQQQSVHHFHRHYLSGVFGVHGVVNALKEYYRKISKR